MQEYLIYAAMYHVTCIALGLAEESTLTRFWRRIIRWAIISTLMLAMQIFDGVCALRMTP